MRWAIGLAWLCLTALAQAQPPQEVVLRAADGLPVYATFYASSPSRPVILLFHQTSSNRGEYGTIAPELVRWGFNALAIDQRSGGGMWNGMNQTKLALGREAGFLESWPDLEAALAWAKARPFRRILAWGSSYSAAMVVLLAARHPEVGGVIAFSPGEYLEQPDLVRLAARQVQTPLFFASTRYEAASVGLILRAAPSRDKTQFIPKDVGQHGSRALLSPYRQEYWAALRPFLIRMRSLR
ncbi:MAG: alpha/beta hydrolase [Meiothermus sp.]|nr:alpha/beta hydrolase [Meiothermus sp.]